MRNFNIMALVLTIGFAFSSVSYAQQETEKNKTFKEKAGENLKNAKDTFDVVSGNRDMSAVMGERSPALAFLSSHQGIQYMFGKYWGGNVFICAFVIIFILIMRRFGSNRSFLIWVIGYILLYLPILRVLVFYIEYKGSDSAAIMGGIALATLLVEVILCRKFFIGFFRTVRESGLRAIPAYWWDKMQTPTVTTVTTPTTSTTTGPAQGTSQMTECPSCHRMMLYNGKCRYSCGYTTAQVTPAGASPSTATGGSTAAPAPVEAPRPKTHNEKVDEAVDLLD